FGFATSSCFEALDDFLVEPFPIFEDRFSLTLVSLGLRISFDFRVSPVIGGVLELLLLRRSSIDVGCSAPLRAGTSIASSSSLDEESSSVENSSSSSLDEESSSTIGAFASALLERAGILFFPRVGTSTASSSLDEDSSSTSSS